MKKFNIINLRINLKIYKKYKNLEDFRTMSNKPQQQGSLTKAQKDAIEKRQEERKLNDMEKQIIDLHELHGAQLYWLPIATNA